MRVLRTCLLGGAAALAGAAAVKPDPTTTYGAWEGWGVSLAWFANVFGGRKDLAQAMYGLGNVSVALGGGGSQVVPGLGFTIGRYNVGGSGPGMTQSPNMPNWKAIAGYWQSDSVWDWTVDANQRAFALQAQAAGATTFELFSNSPMWWMLNNNNPSGSNDGSSDNLASNRYQQHAHYMATVAAYFAANFNITFATVEAFNEPIATWWKASGTQEGCHFDVSTQANVLLRLRGELDAAGLKTTLIASSDESLTDQALATWQGLNASARAVIGQVNVHGYEGASGNRAELYKEVVVQGGKVLRMSEHGDGDASGVTMATNIGLDFGLLHMRSWVYWQALDGGGWGLLAADVANGAVSGSNTKWFVLAQYSRHVRPGDVILSSGDATSNTVAAWRAATNTLILVTFNPNSKAHLTVDYDLTAFGSAQGPVTSWLTTAVAGGAQYAYQGTAPVAAAAFSATIPPLGVQTFEVAGVTA